MIGSRDGECGHGHPIVKRPAPARPGWVEVFALPFDPATGKGCRLCPRSALLTMCEAPVPPVDVDAVLGPSPAP